jgi:hypothetical protein
VLERQGAGEAGCWRGRVLEKQGSGEAGFWRSRVLEKQGAIEKQDAGSRAENVNRKAPRKSRMEKQCLESGGER